MRAADAALVGQLQDPLGARVDRAVHGMAEAGQLLAGGADRARDLARVTALAHALLEQSRARLRGAEDHGAAAEDPRRDRTLQRGGIGRERHPRGDVRGHHPVLGDRDEQQVEEVALLGGRLVAGEQQVEVLGERQPAHEVGRQIAAAHLDPIGIRVADGAPGGHRPRLSRLSR